MQAWKRISRYLKHEQRVPDHILISNCYLQGRQVHAKPCSRGRCDDDSVNLRETCSPSALDVSDTRRKQMLLNAVAIKVYLPESDMQFQMSAGNVHLSGMSNRFPGSSAHSSSRDQQNVTLSM
jgi:hypothetical protein